MNHGEETFEHIGTQPVVVRGVTYMQGATITATRQEMAFLLYIGAVKPEGKESEHPAIMGTYAAPGPPAPRAAVDAPSRPVAPFMTRLDPKDKG